MYFCNRPLFVFVITLLTPSNSATPPNMIFILSDDLGYSELSISPRGPSNNHNLSTPNIDALFHSGMTFSDAYCGEAVCAPSRNSLMTGQHTGHTWIRGNAPGDDGHGLPLRKEDVTILELLNQQGYHVDCVGKWSLGWWNTTGAPNVKGCTTYYGVVDQAYAHLMYPSAPDFTWQYPASDGSLVPESIPIPANINASRERCMSSGNTCVWSHDLWTNAATKAIKAQAERERIAKENGVAAAPFFLYLAYTDPHAGGWSGEEESGNPVPSDDGPVANFALQTSWPIVEQDHASVICNFQDRDVGTIVSLLETTGLRTNTAVMFASDNGASDEGGHDYTFFESSGPFRGFKRCLTEGGIRTPFAFSLPGTVSPGTTSNYTVAFWDLLPTLAELGGVPSSSLPVAIDGVSFVNELLSKPQKEHPPLYWEFCTATKPPGVVKSGKSWGRAVRNGTWKGVSFFEADGWELFDLANDISETTNVANKHPDIVKMINNFAKDAHVDNPNFPSGDKQCIGS